MFGTIKILIATDVSARGIDIPDVEIVVNYDLPTIAENYVHRVGRTGRANKKGVAISFCSEQERDVLEVIESYLTKPIAIMEIDKEEYQATVDFSPESEHDWKSLIKEQIEIEEKKNRKRK